MNRPSPSGLALLAIGLAGAAAGCGAETCVQPEITYSGRAEGRTFIDLSSPNYHDQSLVIYPTIEDALQWNGPGSEGAAGSCWRIAGTETWTLTAWIDVTGTDTDALCADWSTCLPDPVDPQGWVKMAAPKDETTQLVAAITDPTP
jgi:hypothetical protein